LKNFLSSLVFVIFHKKTDMKDPILSLRRLLFPGLLITGLFALIFSSKAQGPKAVVAEPIKDAGTVYRGDKIIHEFSIKNEGNAELAIIRVDPSCGCTTASYDKTINPGKTGKIKVIVDPSSFMGPINKIVTVTTNDSINSPLQLTIKANVIAYINSKPGFARFVVVHGEGGTNESKQIISSSDATPFNITGTESELPNVKITYHEATAEERIAGVKGKQWAVKIVLPEDAAIGPLSSYVHIKTNHPRQEEVDIPISGFVRPMIAVTPATADFGSISVSEPFKKTLEVRNYAKAQINITNVESTVKGIKATSESLNMGRQYQIRITIEHGITKGPFSGKLIIRTDNAKTPVVEVPLKGTIL
jgi:hypothetical protein